MCTFLSCEVYPAESNAKIVSELSLTRPHVQSGSKAHMSAAFKGHPNLLIANESYIIILIQQKLLMLA